MLHPAEIGAALRVEWEGWLDLDAAINEPRVNIFATLVAPVVDERQFGIGDREGDKKDIERAREMAEQACPPEKANVCFAEVFKEATMFVNDPGTWGAIERISHYMLERVEKKIGCNPCPQVVLITGKELQEWFQGGR